MTTSGNASTGAPLAGLRILVTRPARQAAPFAATIIALGGEPVVFPAIAILPPDDRSALAAVHARLDAFDIAIFVSANAAEFGVPSNRPWPPRVAALAPGPGTAEALAALGVPDVSVPRTTQDSEGLLALPALGAVGGKRVAIFRGNGGRELLGDELVARGALVEYVACYRRVPPRDGDALERVLREGVDAVTVTSSEGVDNLWSLLGPRGRERWQATATFAPHARIAERAQALGLTVQRTAAGDAGLLAALLEWAATRTAGR